MSHTDGLKDMSHDTALDAVKDYFDSIVTAVDNVDISLAATITPADDPDGAPAREAQLCNFYAKALIPCLRRLAHEDADKLDLVAAPLTKLYALAHRYTLWRRDRRFPLDDASVDVVLSLFVTPIAHVVMAVHHALLLARLIDGTDVIAPIEIDYEAHITASEQQSPEILYIDGFHRSAAVLFTSEVACHLCLAAHKVCVFDSPGSQCSACKSSKRGNCTVSVNRVNIKVTAFVADVEIKCPGFRSRAPKIGHSDLTLGDVKAELRAAINGLQISADHGLGAQSSWLDVFDETVTNVQLMNRSLDLACAVFLDGSLDAETARTRVAALRDLVQSART